MGQYSYTQPSSSSYTSMTSTARHRSGGCFGFPRRCFCGMVPIIQTSGTDLNPGRRFYGCRNSEDGGYHIFKWWDEAMMEAFDELNWAVKQQTELVQKLKIGDYQAVENCADKPLLETMRINILKTETEIAQLKELMLEKRSGGIELKNLLVAGIILVVLISSLCVSLRS